MLTFLFHITCNSKIFFADLEERTVFNLFKFFSVDVKEGAAVQSQKLFFQWMWRMALLSNHDFFSADVEEGAAVQSRNFFQKM